MLGRRRGRWVNNRTISGECIFFQQTSNIMVFQCWAGGTDVSSSITPDGVYMHTTSLGRQAELISPQQDRSSRQGLDVMTSAEISTSRRTQRCCMYFPIKISIWNVKIKLISLSHRRECDMGWSHHTSLSESQQHECEKTYYMWWDASQCMIL